MVKYFRNLPHFQPFLGTFFVTFRLAGSIPVEILNELRISYEKDKKILLSNLKNEILRKEKLYDLQKLYFGKYDAILDRCEYGPEYLINDKVAEIVYNKILDFNITKYELIALDIEPNHVHMVVFLNEDLKVSEKNKNGKTKKYVLSDTLRLIKGSTSRESNLILNKCGKFWHHESYDHVVRDENELERIINYVLNNPVRSGLVKNRRDWKWSYCFLDFLTT